jgi:hypothetical protein
VQGQIRDASDPDRRAQLCRAFLARRYLSPVFHLFAGAPRAELITERPNLLSYYESLKRRPTFEAARVMPDWKGGI